MRPQYSNPNKSRRTIDTARIVRMPPKPPPEPEAKPARRRDPQAPKRGYGSRNMALVAKYMPHVRRCKKRGHRPRSVPKNILEIIIALNLV
jgi:hypothetical protein